MFKRMIILSCILQLLLFYAAIADDMVTPDLWSYHVDAGKIGRTAEGMSVGDTNLYLNLTTRYKLRTNEYADDQDIYQYLKTSFDEVKAGAGTISGKLLFRFADDINSDDNKQWSDSNYYFYRDLLDKETSENDLAPRLYYGNLVFKGYLKDTTAVLGRQYVDNLNYFHIDGASASYTYKDSLDVYAYGGMTVSYYYENDNDYLYGGGVNFRPLDGTSIQFEANKLDVEDMGDEMFSVKASQQFPAGSVYLKYDNISSANLVEAVGTLRIKQTKTSIRLKYNGQMDKIDINDSSYIVNPFTYSLMDSEEFNKLNLSVNQQITGNVSMDLGGEVKRISGDVNRYNREYEKYLLALNIADIFEGSFFRLSAELMDMDDYYPTNEKQTRLGFQYSQNVTDKVDFWAGIDHQNFVYDYEDDEFKDSVTYYYVGAEWRPLDFFVCSIDLTMEDTEMYEDISDDLDKNYTVETWISFIF